MKLYNKILSTFLAVILMLGAILPITTVGVSAAADAKKENVISSDERIHGQYVKQVYNTPEEKLTSEKSNMKLKLTRGDYELYVDDISGEVAMKNKVTGDILFSNPYDVASSKGSSDMETGTKNEIMSQIVIQYIDNGTTKYLYSFTDAAMREQLNVINVKNGVRVEYTIGREESRKLVPRQISKESFTKFIVTPMQEAMEREELTEFYYKKFMTFFSFQSLAEKSSNRAKETLLKNYPICAEMDIYTLVSDISATELNWVESYIKVYCEDYSFEQMDADHEETGYVATDEKFPLFKLALEYYLDDNGLVVCMPCNGLRYDMAAYTLENFSILPYLGAGHSNNQGYNFYPDGAGSLFDFEQLNTKSTTTVKGKIYGVDYAYHQISGTYQKSIRYPVYGTQATETIYNFTFSTTYQLDENNNLKLDSNKKPINDESTRYVDMEVSNTVMSKEKIKEYVEARFGTIVPVEGTPDGIKETTYKRGYVATITAGESLAELSTYHAGSLSDYNTMKNFFNPKPKDSYDVSDSISVTSSGSTWTVVSERKYTGNIEIHYQMLTDPEKQIEVAGEEEGTTQLTAVKDSGYGFYDTSWLGMAEAYRDYLVETKVLEKMKPEEIEKDIPLYIEVFGAMETQQTFLTFPVDVMTPLTTFENVYEMYSELSTQGVNNINFKMTGYANGGMYSTVPAKLKWEKAVGGASGFRALLQKAAEVNANADKNMGLFPDFDFAYVHKNTSFDDTNLKKDAIKTIDNRYSSKRQYSATKQSYVSFFQLAIAPSRYSKFYEKLLGNYSEYDIKSMSIASLGTALNSDFDEEEPYNREDNKDYTVQAFQDLKEAGYSLMTEGANAYTWGYVDHIINVDLDSSRYIKASASVPFIGAVLHGYVNFAGTALNKEGDTNYAILRAIENGAGLYFILSMQNTSELKEDELLSQYYSVQYDIWKEDVVKYYTQLNNLLKDVQDKVIVAHSFLEGKRVLDLDELQAELEEQLKDAAQAERDKQEAIKIETTLRVSNAWKTAETSIKEMNALLEKMRNISVSLDEDYRDLAGNNGAIAVGLRYALDDAIRIKEGEMVYDNITGNPVSAETVVANLNNQLTQIRSSAISILRQCNEMQRLYDEAQSLIVAVAAAKEVIRSADSTTIQSAEMRDKMVAKIGEYEAVIQGLYNGEMKTLLDGCAVYNVEGEEKYVVNKVMEASKIEDLIRELRPISPDLDEEGHEEEKQQAIDALEAMIAEIMTDCEDTLALFTVEQIIDSAKLEDKTQGEDDTDADQGEKKDKYHVDNNQIVVVSYGTRDDATHKKTYVKSFILNYNNFAVTVDYHNPVDGSVVTYTIPSGGYIVINH